MIVTGMLPRVAIEYGQLACAASIKSWATTLFSPGSEMDNDTAKPKHSPVGPSSTVASIDTSSGTRTSLIPA